MFFTTRPLIVAALVAGSILAHANVSQAGPILDWLFNRRQSRIEARQARRQPVVTNYAPYVAGVAGCNTCNSCTTTCRPACPAPAPQIQVNYTPQTSYKYGWLKVPVTSYKPSSAVDPCTGCAVVSMKPCTSYTWKLSRIPYTTYKPTFTTTQAPTTVSYAPAPSACCGQPTTISQIGSVAPVSTTFAGPASAAPALSSGCSSCGHAPSSMGSAAPSTTYYPPSSTSQYAPPAGGTTTTVGKSYTVPVSPGASTMQPTTASPSPAASSVSPGTTIIQSPAGGAADSAPAINGGASLGGQTSNFGSLGGSQSGATLQASPGFSSSGSSDASVLQGGGASAKSTFRAIETPATASRPSSNLRPVPDPDAHLRQRATQPAPQIQSAPKSGAPRLLDPRDRTASTLIRQAVFVKPSSWPELNAPSTAIAAEPARQTEPKPLDSLIGSAREIRAAGGVQQSSAMTPVTAPALVAPITPRFEAPRVNAQPVRKEPVWDDSGWQSIK